MIRFMCLLISLLFFGAPAWSALKPFHIDSSTNSMYSQLPGEHDDARLMKSSNLQNSHILLAAATLGESSDAIVASAIEAGLKGDFSEAERKSSQGLAAFLNQSPPKDFMKQGNWVAAKFFYEYVNLVAIGARKGEISQIGATNFFSAASQARNRKLEGAIKAAERAAQAEPRNPFIIAFVGRLLVEKCRQQRTVCSDATNKLNKAISFKPDLLGAYFDLGALGLHLKDANRLTDAFSRALELKPDGLHNGWAHFGLALGSAFKRDEATARTHASIAATMGVNFPGQLRDAFGRLMTSWEAAKKGDEKHLKRLISAGFGVNSRNAEGSAILHIAAKNGRTNIAKLAVNAGANLEMRESDNGATALELARDNGHDATAQFLRNSMENSDNIVLGQLKKQESIEVSEDKPSNVKLVSENSTDKTISPDTANHSESCVLKIVKEKQIEKIMNGLFEGGLQGLIINLFNLISSIVSWVLFSIFCLLGI